MHQGAGHRELKSPLGDCVYNRVSWLNKEVIDRDSGRQVLCRIKEWREITSLYCFERGSFVVKCVHVEAIPAILPDRIKKGGAINCDRRTANALRQHVRVKDVKVLDLQNRACNLHTRA